MNLGPAKNVSPTIFYTGIRACADIMSVFGAKGAVRHCLYGAGRVSVIKDDFSQSIFCRIIYED